MMVEKKPDVPTTKVTVAEPFRIVHEQKAYTAGDSFTVDDVTAARWEKAGWVKRAPKTTSTKASTTK
jgi:hypothetical protein